MHQNALLCLHSLLWQLIVNDVNTKVFRIENFQVWKITLSNFGNLADFCH